MNTPQAPLNYDNEQSFAWQAGYEQGRKSALEILAGYMNAVKESEDSLKDGENIQGAMANRMGWEDNAIEALRDLE